MLTIDQVSNILENNTWYFNHTNAVSLYEFNKPDLTKTAPYFTKIQEDVFALKRLPNPNLNDGELKKISEFLLIPYGVDIFPSTRYGSILSDLISKNETLIRWIKSKYEKNDKYGLYILEFRNPLNAPIDVKAFIMKALIVIQTMNNETNKGNIQIPKTLLKGVGNG